MPDAALTAGPALDRDYCRAGSVRWSWWIKRTAVWFKYHPVAPITDHAGVV
jgi:hypothetical protein